MIRNVKNWVEEVFSPKIFSAKEEGVNVKKDLKYRQVLLNQIFEHFKERFEEETTTISISYPVSFVIYLHSNDYKKREANFDRDIIDAVTMFYRHINQILNNTDYRHDLPSYWLFQFVNFQGLSSIEGREGEIIKIEEGKVAILSDIRTTDFSRDNIQAGNNVKSTYHAKDSAKQYDINNESLIAMLDKLPNYKRGLKYFDDDRKQGKVTGIPSNLNNPTHSVEDEAFAVLQCEDKFVGKNGKGAKFYMHDKMIEISGKNAEDKSYIARVDRNNLEDPHVKIKYIPEIKMFQLAAFGDTKLNERPVRISSGGDIHWENLVYNSDILINNEIGITFHKM